MATASKDRTGLFDGTRLTVTPDTGRALLNWLENDQEKHGAEIQEEPDHHRLLDLLADLGLTKHESEYTLYATKRYGVPDLGGLSLGQIKEQLALLQQCKEKQEKLAQFENILRQQKLAA